MDDSITLKGIKQGLLVTIKPDGKWPELAGRLAVLIDSQANFFHGAQITLAVGPRELRRSDLAGLQKLLEKHEIRLVAVLSENAATTDNAAKFGLRTDLAEPEMDTEEVEAVMPKPPPIDPEVRGTPGVLIRHTLRSGRTIHSEGHVIVIGDVNAGAMIVAAGDIIVWGHLRGVVHAGAGGDESAVVCALHLAPTQLRIAGYITISPDERRKVTHPEMAMVRNGRIEAVSWES